MNGAPRANDTNNNKNKTPLLGHTNNKVGGPEAADLT